MHVSRKSLKYQFIIAFSFQKYSTEQDYRDYHVLVNRETIECVLKTLRTWDSDETGENRLSTASRLSGKENTIRRKKKKRIELHSEHT